MSTIAKFLTQPNPGFREAEPLKGEIGKKRGKSHTLSNWPTPKKVKAWKDFDMKSLDRTFGGKVKAILEEHLDIDRHSELLNLGPQRFNSEESLRSVLDHTHRAIVNRALKNSSRRIIKQDLELLRGDDATLYLLTRPGAGTAKPDWAVRSSRYHKHCILPGETKTSWVWVSTDLEECLKTNGDVRSPTAKGLWPIRQIAHYCVLSFARYGFVMTDKELVVIRIRCDEHLNIPKTSIREWKEHVEENMTIEYKSIPWEHSPEKAPVMTMNLALWFLHLLAGNNGQLCVTCPKPLHKEVFVEHEEKIQFEAKLADSQSQSEPSQASQHTTDVTMVDSDNMTNLSFEEGIDFPMPALQQDERGSTRPTRSSVQRSFTRHNDMREARKEVRSALSPKETNTRIQKRRKASSRNRKGI